LANLKTMAYRVKLSEKAMKKSPEIFEGEDHIILEHDSSEWWLVCPNCRTEILIKSDDEIVKCDCYLKFNRTGRKSFRVNPDFYFMKGMT